MNKQIIFIILFGIVSSQKRPWHDNDRVYKAKYMAKYGAMVRKLQFESVGIPDFRVGKAVSKMKPGYGFNADEMGSYMEGDILLPRRRGPVKRQSTFRWPGGIVYYRIDGRFNGQQRAIIKAAMQEFHDKTCVQFRPWTGRQPHFVNIENRRTGCWSAVGRIGGKQRMNLQTPACTFQIGVPIHEFMHVLGIFHEHVRADRDNYVKIGWRNIEHGKEHNFERRSYTGLGEVYDYSSVMHYSSRVFSRNNLPTIYPKLDTERLIGQRNGFSDSDIAKVNRLYDCPQLSLSNEIAIPDYEDFNRFKSAPNYPQDDYNDEELEAIRNTIRNIKEKRRQQNKNSNNYSRPSNSRPSISRPSNSRPVRPPKSRPACVYPHLCDIDSFSDKPWLTKYIYRYYD